MSEDISETYRRNVERPAAIVRTALRMLLGAGLIIALVLKVYMLLLTDHACVEGETTLGALIRCAGTLELIGYALALAAGIEAAASLFLRSQPGVLTTLTLALASGVVLALSRDIAGAAGWRETLSLGALVACLLLLRVFWDVTGRRS